MNQNIDFTGLNFSQLMQSYMSRQHIYTALLSITSNKFQVLQAADGPKDFPYSAEYTWVIDHIDIYVHPMFQKQYLDTFSVENMNSAYDEDREVHFQFLHLLSDGKYHWVTKRATPVHDNSGQKTFICTASNADAERAAADKQNQMNFNMAVINQLIYDYVLVHVVELSNGMSKLAHTNADSFYHSYELNFPSHLAMMKHCCKNFVEESKRAAVEEMIDYAHVKELFDAGEDRLAMSFRDNRDELFVLSVIKYPDYTPDNPLVIYSIRAIEKRFAGGIKH